MVVGDAIGDIQPVGEGDSFIFGPLPGHDYEIANIYIEHDHTVWMRLFNNVSEVFGEWIVLTESLFGANIHLDPDTLLELNNQTIDAIAVGCDGIVTRRPPTVFE